MLGHSAFIYLILFGLACQSISSNTSEPNIQDHDQEDDIVASTTPTSFSNVNSATDIPSIYSDENSKLAKSSGPDLFMFEWYDPESNEICIRTEMKLSLSVPYRVNGSKLAHYTNVTLHQHPEFQGFCGNDTWWLMIRLPHNWNVTAIWQPYYKESFHSTQNHFHFLQSEIEYYSLTNITLQYYLDNDTAPFIIKPRYFEASSYQKDRFVTPFSGYYSCMAKSQLKIGNATFYVSNLRMQIYRSGNTSDFTGNPVVRCLSDIPVDTIVPLAVGIALAVLTVMILLAYVIGLQRYQTAEYETFVNT